MDMRKFGFLFVRVIALSVLMMRCLGGRQRVEGLFLGFRDTAILASPELNVDLMEQIWLYCGLDFMDMKEVLRSSGFSNMEDFICDSTQTNLNLSSRFFLKSGKLETMTFLSLQIKHELLSCLSRQNFHFNVPGDDNRLINMYMEYLESLLGCNLVSRRHLADQPLQDMAPASAPAPGPSPVSASSPGPGVEPPSFGPAPSSDLAPANAPVPDNHSSGAQMLSPNTDNLTPVAAPVLPSKKPNNSKRSVIIAVVLAAAGTSLIAACIFCCYNKCCRDSNDSTFGQREERPLMTLSLGNFSGLSPKSFGQGSSIHNDKIGGFSIKTDPGQNDHVLCFEVSSNGTQSSDVPSGYSISSTEMSNISSNAFEPEPPPPSPVMLPSIKKVAPSPPAPSPPAPPPPPVMPPIRKVGPAPPAPPPHLRNSKPGPPPPPPRKGALPPHVPLGGVMSRVTRPSPLGPNHSGDAASDQHFGAEDDANAPKEKTKLKPFFWDKVLANPDQSMVWHQIRSGSFQFNEEMIEMLFGYNSANRNKCEGKKESSSNDPSTQYVQLINPKKSQNLAISLKALNVKTEEVCDALMEGNKLPMELLKTLLRISLTTDEELKLRLYSGNLSLVGPAEQFLKVVVDIPFAFKRIDALLFMASLQEDTLVIKESFATLEVACKELRSSRLFLKLLEAVLKMGNRMNDGTFRGDAQAFRLDTLLKLSDVKGTDGKTTLLHFVVQEIIRSEGVRAACCARESGSTSSLMTSGLNSEEGSPRESGDYYCSLGLKVISGLGNELENVKKAAGLDAGALTNMMVDLARRLLKTKEFLNKDMGILDEDSGFYRSLTSFVEHAEADVTFLLEEEKRIKSLVKSTTNYFHGNAGKDEGLRLFVIVRDFLRMLDKACKQVRESAPKVSKTPNIRDNSPMAHVPDPRQMLFPAIRDRRVEYSSSDDEES